MLDVTKRKAFAKKTGSRNKGNLNGEKKRDMKEEKLRAEREVREADETGREEKKEKSRKVGYRS